MVPGKMRQFYYEWCLTPINSWQYSWWWNLNTLQAFLAMEPLKINEPIKNKRKNGWMNEWTNERGREGKKRKKMKGNGKQKKRKNKTKQSKPYWKANYAKVKQAAIL